MEYQWNTKRGRQGEFVDLIVKNEMIPLVAKDNLADFIDVFCDKGFLLLKKLIEY